MKRRDRGRSADAGEVEALEDFLDSLDILDEVQLLGIDASWRARDRTAHENAWTAVVAAAADSGLTRQMEQARDAALNWAIRGTNAPWPYAPLAENTWLDLRRQVGPALADAAVAIFLGRRLGQEESEILLAPWASAGGERAPRRNRLSGERSAGRDS